MCRLEAAANLVPPASFQDFSSGLVTGGTGSLGCLVARWLLQQNSAATPAHLSPLASQASAKAGPQLAGHPLQQSHEQQRAVEPTQNGIAIELLGRSGRANAAVHLLSSSGQLPASVTVRQCDASCREATAAVLQQGCQVSGKRNIGLLGAQCLTNKSITLLEQLPAGCFTVSGVLMQGTGQAIFHAAGSLSDALVAKQTAAGVRQVFAAKVQCLCCNCSAQISDLRTPDRLLNISAVQLANTEA